MTNFISPENGMNWVGILKQVTKMTDFEAKWVKTGRQKQLWYPERCKPVLLRKANSSFMFSSLFSNIA